MAWTAQEWTSLIIQAAPSVVLIIGAWKGRDIIQGIRDDANQNAAAAKVGTDIVRSELATTTRSVQGQLDDNKNLLGVVHEQTNGSLAGLKVELIMANEKITRLEAMLITMKAERDQARDEAAKVRTKGGK